MKTNPISSTNLAENIAKMQVAQNNTILQKMMFQTPRCNQQGFFEDPYGQTVYQDGFGNCQRIYSYDDINGWTV